MTESKEVYEQFETDNKEEEAKKKKQKNNQKKSELKQKKKKKNQKKEWILFINKDKTKTGKPKKKTSSKSSL